MGIGGHGLDKNQLDALMILTRSLMNRRVVHWVSMIEEGKVSISELEMARLLRAYHSTLQESKVLKTVRLLKKISQMNLSRHSNYDDEFAYELYCKIRSLHMPTFVNMS